MKKKVLFLSILSILLAIFTLFARSSDNSDLLVTEAWKAWEVNDQQQVEKKFLKAIEQDKSNTRAYLGLSFLYELQDKHEESWDVFKNILETEKNYYPYIFSAWLTSKLRTNYYNQHEEVIELFEKLCNQADSSGTLQTMACEELGVHYQKKKQFEKANQYFERINDIKEWMLIGPFDNISASGFEKEYPPELEFNPSKRYEGKNSVPAEWFKIPTFPNYYWINFLYHFYQSKAIFYANNFLYSPKKQKVQLRIGTSGSLKAFLNDELVIEYFDENNNDIDTYVAETELQQGWNRLLIKCGYSEIERCNFLVRVTDNHGNEIQGLKVSTDEQSYPKRPNASVRIIENFAEKFFKQKIEKNPDHLENYILLADTYLRNDKAIEAELVLREAVKLSPNCALFHQYLLEAYRRGEKYDERSTTMEKIFSLDKYVPQVLEYKFSEYLENEDYDKAEQMIQYIEKVNPNSEMIYELKMDLYIEKDQTEKLLEITNEAYKLFLMNWTFVDYQAYLSIETTAKYDQAIKIYSDYLDKKYTTGALSSLADTYLDASDIKKWGETRKKMFQLNPAAPGYYFNMAKTYFELQDYSNAQKMIDHLIEVAPGCSHYWAKLGEICRATNEISQAKIAYKKALQYKATNYEAREALRELEGKKSIFQQFEAMNIDSLVKNAPARDLYPDDDAIILLNDYKRVVYERGASERSEEKLIRLFNKNGIDAFKEFYIDYNSYTEYLIIEKAVAIKKDGSQIEADIDENYLVFKTLEENDFIYMKWRIKNYYSGKLAKHFWDMSYFSTYYPIKYSRYAILLPEHIEFNYKLQNMSLEPITKQTEDGIIKQWSLADEPAIKYEYQMPWLNDVGKILYISNIPNWKFINEWYTDIARTKTRSSYEIKELVQQLFEGRESIPTSEKIKIIYDYITENIHYSSVSFRQSAYIPQKARDVLVTKIGDCKDVTTLAIAMLKEVGIEAHYVLLNTKNYGLNKNIVPSIAFNHVIAGIETANGLKYLDFTATNYPDGTIPEIDKESFILAVKPNINEPEYLAREIFVPSNIFRECNVEINDDNSITVRSKSLRTGSLSGSTRTIFRHKSQQEREKSLSESLNKFYPNLEITKFDIENLDNLKQEVSLVYHYEVPNYISETGQFNFFKVPWEFIFAPQAALSYEQRKYPFCYWPGVDTLHEEIKVKLPAEYEPVEPGQKIDLQSPVADYAIHYSFSEGILNIKKDLIYKKTVVNPDEYVEFKKFYNDFVKQDSQQILLKRKI